MGFFKSSYDVIWVCAFISYNNICYKQVVRRTDTRSTIFISYLFTKPICYSLYLSALRSACLLVLEKNLYMNDFVGDFSSMEWFRVRGSVSAMIV